MELYELIGGIGFMLGAFVLAIMIIVFVHEYGHYIVARWCGVHSEVFSIGMGPALWERCDKRGTVWRIASLPIGGYVRFSNDGNAASLGSGANPDGQGGDKKALDDVSLWKRSAVVAAGPIANFILSIVVFFSLSLWIGIPREDVVIGEMFEIPDSVNMLEPGDRILSVAGIDLTNDLSSGEIARRLPEQRVLDYRVERNGDVLEVEGPHFRPALVTGLVPRGAAREAGLERGDVIVRANGDEIISLRRLSEYVTDQEGAEINLEVWRDGSLREVSLSPRMVDLPNPDGGFEQRWLIGINTNSFFIPQLEKPTVLHAVWIGFERTWYVITSSLSGIYHIIVGAISSCNISGPISIAETTGEITRDNVLNFPMLVAVLSTAVGLMNLMPIPILDGGHLLMHAYEGLARRKPSPALINILFYIGIITISSIMLLAISNDFFC